MAEVRALQDVGQFTASIEELREILAIVPDLPEASYRLGVALVQTGEASRAIWALEKAAESPEYAIPASLLLASAHMSSNSYESAIKAADRVLELDPERHAALRVRSRAYLGTANHERALEDAERLLEAFPEDYSTVALHATILADMDRTDEALAAHQRLREIALESGDAQVAPRGCAAEAMFYRDYMKDAEKTSELFDDCLERFPSNGLLIGEAMKFYDGRDERDKATAIVRRAVEEAPENLGLRSQLANRLANAGDPDAAEEVLMEAADSFKSAGAYNMLANFYRQQGESAKALEAIEKVSELAGGGNDQLRFTRADVLIDVDRLEEAETVAAELQEPVYANLIRGRIALERGDAATALELFEKGIRAWPDNAGARYLAGLAARDLGDMDRAISELREAVRADASATAAAEVLARIHYERGEYRESLKFGRNANRRRGADRRTIFTLGARSLTELEEYDEARKTARALSELEDGRVHGIVELARVERAASGPAAGRAVIEQSGLDLSAPENEVALRMWSEMRIAEGETARALARVDEAIASDPGRAGLHELRGNLLTDLGRDDDARKAFEKALEIDPEMGGGHAGLATLSARGGDLDAGIASFDRAAELSPETSAYLYAAAQLAYASKDLEGAERRLREVVRRFPGHVGGRNDLAWILAEREKELDTALELAEEAQRLDPSPEVLDTLGWVYFKRGELSAAVAAFEQAVEARNNSPSIRYRLGLALSRAGDPKRAKENLEAALAAGTFPEAAAARRELAQLDPN